MTAQCWYAKNLSLTACQTGPLFTKGCQNKSEGHRRFPIIIYVHYPNVNESPGYLKPRIQIELRSRSLIEPFTVQKISSMLDEYYPDAPFTEAPIDVPTVDPERTILKKIFLLHEEFQRSDLKIRVDCMSRHLYDIYKLASSPFGEKALINRELYTEIVFHHHLFTKLGGIDYKLNNPRMVNPIPPDHLLDFWQNGYLTMPEQMIYAKSPGFEEMIETIRNDISKLNQLDWEILK